MKRTFFEEKSRIFQEALDESHGLVFRCLSAYYDQGISPLPLPERETPLLEFFFTYFKSPLPLAQSWRKKLSKNIKIYRQRKSPSNEILLELLTTLGIPPQEWKHYLFFLLYQFKGWSAMVKARSGKSNFEDFAAILLLCEVSKIQDYYHSNMKKIESVGKNLPTCHPVRKVHENNLRGIIRYLLTKQGHVKGLMQIPEEELLPLFELCLTFHNFFKRKLYQKALDRKSEREFLGAILSCQKTLNSNPKFIALFCIDEREESLRRHLEECEPNSQTEGTAGHFGLNIEFKAYRKTHYRKLCPAPQVPILRVKEEAPSQSPFSEWSINRLGQITSWIEHATLHPIYGTLVTFILSPLISIGLFLRIFYPRLYAAGKKRVFKNFFKSSWNSPFTIETQTNEDLLLLAKAIAETLITSGLKNIQTPYLFIVGHGSTSLNNPHEAAHDCGACAGGRGWPNAKLFAELANRPDIREMLKTFGVILQPSTRFIGTFHNTSSDDVEFMDLPESISTDLQKSMDAFKTAAKKNAFERNRRFLDIPLPKNSDQAKTAMIQRSVALDQVRPEYGHATNAYAVIGPRHLTRGLFMDRRSFLCSYNFQDDPEGTYLKSILQTVIPVCVGINLEYYFSWVDRKGYGCDTKIPHNINGLTGVMNGYMSDLLLGLPLQMTEIHRPVRLKVLMAAPPAFVKSLLKEMPEITHEIDNEWFYLVLLDPETGGLFSWSKGDFQHLELPQINFPTFKDSLEYIVKYGQGNRDFLNFALKREHP
ncbi:MAG: DUF2309 family protein [Deltaproteobacteria bacterium]|nr:DUF2309 family protein [Deltaproteobacteria bacterium]